MKPTKQEAGQKIKKKENAPDMISKSIFLTLK